MSNFDDLITLYLFGERDSFWTRRFLRFCSKKYRDKHYKNRLEKARKNERAAFKRLMTLNNNFFRMIKIKKEDL